MVLLETTRSIGYTQSPDGEHWSTPEIVVKPDSSVAGQTDVNRPTVSVVNGFYHMWFTGQSAIGSQIYYATSSDGLSWTKVAANPVIHPEQDWEKVAVMCPDVLWDPAANIFKMWYSAGEQYEPDAIGYATSPNGLQWKRPNSLPTFSSDPKHPWEKAKVTGGNVHLLDGWYIMFYIGFADVNHAGIGLARSRDGVKDWQRHPLNPILQPPGVLNPLAWDRDAIYRPAALLDDRGWSVWFNGRRSGVEQIGLAKHARRDLGFDTL